MTVLPTCILIADDEASYVRIIKFNLDQAGYRTLFAADGLAVVELAASQPVDLILLDVRMPKLDGFEACRRIRLFSAVPIVFITAGAEEIQKVAGFKAGASDYLTKPFTRQELMARVAAFVPPPQI